MNCPNTRFSSHRLRQQGSALIISLFILLVLTIIGVNSMSSLVLEERMASNSRQSMMAAQQAEIALRAGEAWIAGNISVPADIPQFSSGSAELYSQHEPIRAPFDVFDESLWATGTNSQPVNVSVDPDGPKSTLVTQSPRYIIEYLGRTGVFHGDLKPSAATLDTRDYVFRVTAIGWGEDVNAKFLVQSTYRITL